MKLERVKEGETVLEVPRTQTKSLFYNPLMEFDRDLSVASCSILKPSDACDALAACGARGIRYMKESKTKVWLNDANPKAVEQIKKNLALNGLNTVVSNKDARSLLMEENFDLVDIDPFGSPASFLLEAASSAKKWLAVTATDIGCLSGVYSSECKRRYDVKSCRTDFRKELGARILITTIKKAFKNKKTYRPLLTYYRKHYFRTIGEICTADKEMGWISYCLGCGNRTIGPKKLCECGSSMRRLGKLWLGKLSSKKFCAKLCRKIENSWWKNSKKEVKLLMRIQHELNIPFYWDLHKLFKRFSRPVPPFNQIGRKLEKEGYKWSRTHFCETGIKTDCPSKRFMKLYS